MAYFSDLSPYVYSGRPQGAVNVGWLGWRNPFFKRGRVSSEVINKLMALALQRESQTRGYHRCPFCTLSLHKAREIRLGEQVMELGSAEIHVKDSGVTYIAPNLIIHYIEKHSYCPPGEFIAAVMKVER